MGLNLDFTNVADGFDVIPKGTYDAVVYAIEQKESQSSGQPYLNWQFKIQGGEMDGRIAFDATSLQQKALWKLKAHLKAIDPDLSLDGNVDLDTDELLGSEVRIVIDHEKWEGQARARVKKVLPYDATAGAASDIPDFMK